MKFHTDLKKWLWKCYIQCTYHYYIVSMNLNARDLHLMGEKINFSNVKHWQLFEQCQMITYATINLVTNSTCKIKRYVVAFKWKYCKSWATVSQNTKCKHSVHFRLKQASKFKVHLKNLTNPLNLGDDHSHFLPTTYLLKQTCPQIYSRFNLQPIQLEKFTAHFNEHNSTNNITRKCTLIPGITEQMYKHSTET